MNKLRFNVIGFVSICAIASLSAAEKGLSPLSATIAEARMDINTQRAQIKNLQEGIQQNLELSSSDRAQLDCWAEKASDNNLQAKISANIAFESRRDEKDPKSRENALAFLGDAAKSLNAKPTLKDIQHRYDDESSKAQERAARFQKEQDEF